MKYTTAAKILAGGFVAVVAAMLLLLVTLRWWLHERPFSSATFDRSQWMTGNRTNDDRDCIRGAMANDIIDTIATPGRSRADVERQLGPADRIRGDMAHYDLGMCSGLRVDYDDLDIEYIDGKVSKVGHSQS
ncbi:MAG: hypothetical protein ACREP4_08995 [Stenotrophomonas sp.]|uniref:hypothetical protein n=1 Tax=Stenotrophomonas sp. TaxID=69392 RepID=UPI003D6CA0B8